MKTTNTQFITDGKGNKQGVILSMQEYKKIVEKLEDFEDLKLYDEVKGRNEKSIPFADYLKKRNKSK